MSYDLEVIASVNAPIDLVALAADVRARVDLVAPAPHGKGLAVDGGGFVVEPTARGVKLSSHVDRGPRDEWAMEWCACLLAGANGTVLDRHTGRTWTVAVLDEWLRVAPLFSGRAMACNEERIAHARAPVALQQLTQCVDTMVQQCAGAHASPALRKRVHDELIAYVSRPHFVWIAARALAGLGDLGPLENLTRTVPHGSEIDPFVVAASFGAQAVPLFTRALTDPDPNHRRAAARALHHLHHDDVFALVKRALEDKRSTVREAMLEANFEVVMVRPGARDALGASLERLAHDTSSVVRKLVAKWG